MKNAATITGNVWNITRTSWRLPQYNDFEETNITLNGDVVLSIDDNANHINRLDEISDIPDWVIQISEAIDSALERYYDSIEEDYQRPTFHGFFTHPDAK